MHVKICFIGLGSIGKRHLRNIHEILSQRNTDYRIDCLRSSKATLSADIEMMINTIYYDLEELDRDYDIIFVTNPTYLHFETISKVMVYTKYLFVEKPIFDHLDYDYEELSTMLQDRCYVACPLRFSSVIQYLKEHLQDHKVYAARVICSSYLPQWRKEVDYRSIYSAIKEQGGGVELDLIHEWDYLSYLFGLPNNVQLVLGKYSNLEISSNDLAMYIGEYDNMLVQVHLDYFGRTTKRQIEFMTDQYTITADLLKSTICFEGDENFEVKLLNEDMYVKEMNYFIDMVQGKKKNINSIKNAIEILKVALGA